MNGLLVMLHELTIQRSSHHEPLFKSWKGVKRALYRSEALNISTQHMCSEGHQRLPIGRNEVLSKCETKGCRQNVKSYDYLGIWERLRVRLRDDELGPELFDYYRSQLNFAERGGHFQDVFDGRLFRQAVEQLGGLKRSRTIFS